VSTPSPSPHGPLPVPFRFKKFAIIRVPFCTWDPVLSVFFVFLFFHPPGQHHELFSCPFLLCVLLFSGDTPAIAPLPVGDACLDLFVFAFAFCRLPPELLCFIFVFSNRLRRPLLNRTTNAKACLFFFFLCVFIHICLFSAHLSGGRPFLERCTLVYFLYFFFITSTSRFIVECFVSPPFFLPPHPTPHILHNANFRVSGSSFLLLSTSDITSSFRTVPS